MADPGVQAQDGFEGTLAARNSGSSIVTGVGTIGAISGAHSLLIQANAALTLHLQRTGDTKNLHFAVRSFVGGHGSQFFTRRVQAAVVGSSKVLWSNVQAPNVVGTATGDALFPSASPVEMFDAVLDGSGSDVLLRVDNPDPYCLGPCPASAAWLIDDLRIE